MKLVTKIYVGSEDVQAMAVSGVYPKTYLVGTFMADLINAGYEDAADQVMLDDFEVERLPPEVDAEGTTYTVALLRVDEELACEMLDDLKELYSDQPCEYWIAED